MSKRKLLLADDSITIQKVVNLTFADEGIEVISVGDGNSAMDKLREDLPDLVMADVNMPGLNGYEVCDNIKQTENSRDIPVILLVGSFEPFDEDEAKRVGANDYLTKPFQSISQLVDKVSGLLKLEEEPLSEKAEASFNNGGATHLQNDMATSESALTDDFNLPKDEFDDEMIQTDQIGSLPIRDAAKFEAGPEKPKIIDDEIIENQSKNEEPLEDKNDLQSELNLENEMDNALSEPFTEIPTKDFNITQPLSDAEIQELAVEDASDDSFEMIESDNPEEIIASEEMIESDNPEEIIKSENDSLEETTKQLEDTIQSEETNSEEDELELPLPEAASVLELDEFNLLDLPPLEDGSEASEARDESIAEAEALGEKTAKYFADEEEKKKFIETSATDETSEKEDILNEEVSPEMVADVTRKVVERLSERAVREIAWEVVPELAELIIKKLVEEKMKD